MLRGKRYNLNPVKIEPKVKTDAKDLILEFIRSRPPLKPVSQVRQKYKNTNSKILLNFHLQEGPEAT